MDRAVRKEARKQYLRYFRVWFIVVFILLAVWGVAYFVSTHRTQDERGNQSAPDKRVYDYAGVLSEAEEQKLEAHIASCEAKYHIDLVLVTINEAMEGGNASWEQAMMNYADDFYDENNYGYDTVHGDGALLLDNWYEGQKGSWLSTCGSVYERFGNGDINQVLRAVYRKVENDPYGAYRAYVDTTCRLMSGDHIVSLSVPWWITLFLPIVIAVLYAASHLRQSKAQDTTRPETYVLEGTTRLKTNTDQFLRKSVSTRHIETSSGGGGNRSSGGFGGGHVSSGGISHGGGGMRR